MVTYTGKPCTKAWQGWDSFFFFFLLYFNYLILFLKSRLRFPMSLIFFKNAHFGYVTKTVLMTYQCFGCCSAVLAERQRFLFFPTLLCTPNPIRSLEVRSKLGGDTSWRADSNWLKGYSTPCNTMLSNKTERRGFAGRQSFAQRLAGHHSAYGRWRVIALASLVLSSSFLPLLDYPYLDSWVPLLLFLLFSPPSCCRRL